MDGFLDDYAVDFGLNEASNKAQSEGNGCFPITSLLGKALAECNISSEGSVLGAGVIAAVPWWVDTLFLPINHKQSHWSLVVIDRKGRRFFYYDSLYTEAHEGQAKIVVDKLAELCKIHLGICEFLYYQWIKGDCSQQTDGINCGVHVILNARSVISSGNCATIYAADCKEFRECFISVYNGLSAIRSHSFVKRRRLPERKVKKEQETKPDMRSSNKENEEVPVHAKDSKGDATATICQTIKALDLRGIVSRIPKGARVAVASLLHELLDDVIQTESVNSWFRLFAFPSICLKKLNRKEKGNLTTHIKSLISRLKEIDVSAMATPPKEYKTKIASVTDKDVVAGGVSAKLADGDIKGAIRLLSSESKLAPNNNTTIVALQEKHPKGPSDICMPEIVKPSNHLHIAEQEVMKAVRTFPCGSSGGVDGLIPQHLKYLLSVNIGCSSSQLLRSLVALTNKVAEGEIIEAVKPIFFGARLVALEKKGGRVRPIAVGCTLRRLVAKVCNWRILRQAESMFAPLQLGLGVRNGYEAAVHAMREYLGANLGGDEAVLKIDLSNAFNSIRRDHLMTKVQQYFPQLFPFIASSYSIPSFLIWNGQTIISEHAVQQGDPLGPFLFCISINEIVRSLHSEMNVWFMDDGTIGGKPEVVIEDFGKIVSKAKAIGLEINSSKCELIMLTKDEDERNEQLEKFRKVMPGISVIEPKDVQLLGSALHMQGVDDILRKRLKSLELMSERLEMIDRHDALFLLRNTFSLPKLAYLFRTAPCYQSTVLIEYETVLLKSLESILNCPIDGHPWDRGSLPVREGGLGVGKASDLVLPAFLRHHMPVKC